MPSTVGYIQFEPRFAAVDENVDTIQRLVKGVEGADLLVLPELAATGYDFRDGREVLRMAEPAGQGPLGKALIRLAHDRNVTLVCGYAEHDGDRLYNASLLVTPDGDLTSYRKLHLFSREKLFFAPGDADPPVVETPAGRVGMMICFDWFFPETARILALKGAQIIAHPSNLVLPWCQQAMFARSVENRVFTITANRIGTEAQAARKLTFTGGSQVLDCEGHVLSKAPDDLEYADVVAIDPAEADSKQLNAFNNLFADRRKEHYGSITEV